MKSEPPVDLSRRRCDQSLIKIGLYMVCGFVSGYAVGRWARFSSALSNAPFVPTTSFPKCRPTIHYRT